MNKNLFYRIASVILIFTMLVAFQSPTPTAAAPVEIKYHFRIAIQKDIKVVEEALNAMLVKKNVNAVIRLTPFDDASHTEKTNLMFAAGETCDSSWTAPWVAPSFSQLVSNGNLLPLDDLLKSQAPELMKDMPAQAWDATKIGGKIYGVPNQQIWVKPFGFIVRKDLADKYKLDADKVQKYEDLEPFLAAMKKGEAGIIPISLADGQPASIWMVETFGYDPIVTQDVQAVVKYDDKNLKVLSAYDTPEFKAAVSLAYKWAQAGYFPKDLVARADEPAAFKANKFATKIGVVIKPGGEVEWKKNMGIPQDAVQKSVTVPFMTTASVTATMTSICKSSKNPDMAMKLINLFNTDAELYNTLAKGIEGKHWVWVDKDKKLVGPGPDNANYKPGRDWMLGNTFKAYYIDPAQAAVDMIGATKKLNDSSAASVALGFSFDPSPVKNEIANVTSVVKELGYPLINGMVDPEKTLPEFQKKAKEAGMDKIIAEAQKQIDAWKATKK